MLTQTYDAIWCHQATMRMLTTILHIFLSENLIWNIQQLKKLCEKKIVFAASTVLANERPWTVKIIGSGDCFNMETIFPGIGIPTIIIAFRFRSSHRSRLWSKILFLSIQRCLSRCRESYDKQKKAVRMVRSSYLYNRNSYMGGIWISITN